MIGSLAESNDRGTPDGGLEPFKDILPVPHQMVSFTITEKDSITAADGSFRQDVLRFDEAGPQVINNASYPVIEIHHGGHLAC